MQVNGTKRHIDFEVKSFEQCEMGKQYSLEEAPLKSIISFFKFQWQIQRAYISWALKSMQKHYQDGMSQLQWVVDTKGCRGQSMYSQTKSMNQSNTGEKEDVH